jgi:hypothetical protein
VNENLEAKKKPYEKPRIEIVRLSLAEVTLGTNCQFANPTNAPGNCGAIFPPTCSQVT